MRPLRTRILPVLGLLLGAPVTAEYLQAYLTTTGDLWVQFGGLLILGPLYGGAALLIREVGVRTGRGWPGVLLLAAAFGVLMPGVIDRTLWLEHNPDVPYWEELRRGTYVEAFGFPANPLLSWATGHVLYSVGAPLAMLHALAPRLRGRPLLGRTGLGVLTLLWLVAAALIHGDQGAAGSGPSPSQAMGVLAGALVLVALALSRWGRPLAPPLQGLSRGRWTPGRVLALGLVAALALDLLPTTWPGTAAMVLLLVGAGWGIARAAGGESWGLVHVTALASGGLVARCLIGFLAPLPPGADGSGKSVQSSVLLLLVVLLAHVALRRAQLPEPQDAAPRAAV